MTRRLLAALVLSCAFPATAGATTISVDGGPVGSAIAVSITVTGGPGTDSVTVNQGNGDALTVTAGAGSTFAGSLVTPDACTPQANVLHCRGFFPTRVDVDGTFGDGSDNLNVSGLAPVTGGSVDMGDGTDSVQVIESERHRTGAVWTIHGGAGDDHLFQEDSPVEDGTSAPTHDVLDGGTGNDQLWTFAGTDDIIDGGAGDDWITMEDDVNSGVAGGGSATGGPGTDLYETENSDAPMTVSLDANGGVGGSGLLLPATSSGFENLEGDGVGDGAITLVGNDGPNVLTPFTHTPATLIGNGGDDVLTGDAGAVDTFRGGAGNDRIDSRDGLAETVDCGPDLDTDVQHDPQDTLIDCEAAPVVITGGPTGTLATPDATFEFAAVDPPPGATLECQLDSGPFTACTSPRTLIQLPDGPHAFRVRVVSGGTPSDASTRTWTIDTTPPGLSIDSAPSGSGNPADVTIAFHADGPATFRCAVDGGAEADCASPLRLTGLAEGSHQVAIKAVDDVGNASAAQLVGWGVGEPAGAGTTPVEQAIQCPAGADRSVAFGVLVAAAAAPDACFVPSPGNGGARQSPGPVRVNGVLLTPKPGGLVILDSVVGGGRLRTTGAYTVSLGSASFDMATPLTLDGLASLGGQIAQRNIAILGNDLPKLFDLPLRGSVKWEFSTADGGTSKVTLTVSLPRIFRPVPDGTIGPPPPTSAGPASSTSGVTFTAIATASNAKGVSFAGKAKISELYLFGKVKLKDVELGVDLGKGTFSGSAGIALNESGGVDPKAGFGKDALLTVTLEIGDGGLFGTNLRKLTLAASQLEKFIGDGVYLQRMGGELAAGTDLVGRPAVVLSTTGGASLGPRLSFPPFFEGEAVSIDGTAKLMIPTEAPPSVSMQVEGIGKIVDVPVTDEELSYTAPGRIEYHGNVDATLAGFGLFGAIRSSWFDAAGLDFNIEAAGGFRVPGLGAFGQLTTDDRQAEGVFSKTGFAVCVGDNGERFGFGKRWGEGPQIFAEACDLGPFRSTAAAARAGGARSFSVRRGTPVLAVALRGIGAPPKVDVRGPHGASAATPDGPEPADGATALVVQDPRTTTTWLVLHHPAAGRWTVTPRPGSTLGGLDVADPLPPAHVRVRVTGHGRHRTLSWRMPPVAGQSLTLTELGSRAPARLLVRTRRARGRVALVPRGAAGTRRILATVTHAGLPRLNRVVARYRAPAPPRLRRVRAIRRHHGVLSWKGQPGADAYAVALAPSGGTTFTATTRRPRLKLPARARHGRLGVTIVAVADGNRHGPVATVRLKR